MLKASKETLRKGETNPSRILEYKSIDYKD